MLYKYMPVLPPPSQSNIRWAGGLGTHSRVLHNGAL